MVKARLEQLVEVYLQKVFFPDCYFCLNLGIDCVEDLPSRVTMYVEVDIPVHDVRCCQER